MKINSANKRAVGEANDLPDMSGGIQMYYQKLVLNLVTTQNDKGYARELLRPIYTMGVRVTQTARQLALKPEGERSWKWSTLYTEPGTGLSNDDIVSVQGTRYRVTSNRDNKEYGCMEYELLEDYTNET